ncbi:MAG: hypothetical protein ACJAT5_000711 [Lentimonas sp.]|jgi:hypothetical protein
MLDVQRSKFSTHQLPWTVMGVVVVRLGPAALSLLPSLCQHNHFGMILFFAFRSL